MKLMVLDGNSIANRAYYGVRPLNAPDGTPTNAVFGFLGILFRLLQDETPDALCVTFDVHAPTFRKQKYDGYKAQRKGMPEDLAAQMPILKEIMDAMNIPHYGIAGYEADDLMGTISLKSNAAGWDCVLVTGDKDSFQLIGGGTVVRHVKSSMGQSETVMYDTDAFREEYGFEPAGIIELKALMGDSSDNIPGVAGVGEKTALDLVRRFGTVERIYNQLDTLDIKDAVRKKLAAGKEMAALSRELVVIDRHVPMEFNPQDALRKPVDNDRLYELFMALGLKKYIERMELTAPGGKIHSDIARCELQWVEVADSAAADAMLAVCEKSGAALALAEDLTAAAVAADGKVYTLDFAAITGGDGVLRHLLSDKVSKTGHDIKDTIRRILEAGYDTDNWAMDTALAAYLIDPMAKDYDIIAMADECFGAGADEGDEQLGLFDLTGPLRSRACAIYRLAPVLVSQVDEAGMGEVLRRIELPLCRVLAEMEIAGFYVDGDALRDFGVRLSAEANEIAQMIYSYAGGQFNINSPKQLGEVLFEKLMLPAPKKTKTGYSTNVDVLEKLKDKHPIAGLVLEYRELTKLTSTYVDGLLKVRDSDGRIRTNFQMTVTATGRLSSTEPNLQNIPIRKALGGEVRKMFTAGPGNVLVDADYSQIELRLLACMSGDEVMRRAFLSGEDIHRVTAAQVLGIAPEDVTPQQRSHAKAVNFGIVYGISAFSLSQDIGVSVGEAQRYIDSYLDRYSGVAEYMDKTISEASEKGFVSTIYGRRRSLPELKSSNRNVRAFGERVARNAPIQGTAADIMKLAMIAVHSRLKKEGLRARLIMQVHDELIVECPEDEKDIVARILTHEMQNAASLPIPLTAQAGVGFTWYDAK